MTDTVVVDTSVVSYQLRNDTRAALYRPHLAGRRPVLSFVTLAELDRWAIERNWGEGRIARMEQFLTNYVVYPYDRALCRTWARVSCDATRNGHPLHANDAWIAATALLHGLPLVSHDKDYAGVEGLALISEAH